VILLFGPLGDDPLAAVLIGLADRGVDLMLIDPRDSPDTLDFACEPTADGVRGWLRSGERTVELDAVSASYVRDTGAIHDPGGRERHVALCVLLDRLPALVVNRPSASATNWSKPYQAKVIARCGLAVPRTLLTTDPEQARTFYDACRGRVIFKSAGHNRSIVTRLGPGGLDRLAHVRSCPTQFQEYVPGVDVRVHVVGERIFATEIDTAATDYRYAGRVGAEVRLRDTRLPDEIAASCRRLAGELGLVIAGIDLRRTPDGRWFCFEANPSPAFTWYEELSGQPITDALCDLFCSASMTAEHPLMRIGQGGPDGRVQRAG
jgi:glutathione synthase/RimK-type ligase-like ATP-grasp enzyme